MILRFTMILMFLICIGNWSYAGSSVMLPDTTLSQSGKTEAGEVPTILEQKEDKPQKIIRPGKADIFLKSKGGKYRIQFYFVDSRSKSGFWHY